MSGQGGPLVRVDPATNSIIENVPLACGFPEVAAGGGAVWVVCGSDTRVMRVDETTNSLDARITVRNPTDLAASESAVWTTNPGDGTVTRIDYETLDVATFPVGGRPIDIAAGEGGVWVTVQPS